MRNSNEEGTSQGQAEPSHDSTESNISNSHEVNDVSSSEDSDDGWGSAREAFFEGKNDSSSDGDEVKQEGGDDSHLEADQTEQGSEEDQTVEPSEGEEFNVKYDLDGLPIPHKYKPLVKQEIETILGRAKEQATKLTAHSQQTTAEFAKAFIDIVRSDDPMQTLYQYAQSVVPAYNLPEDLVKNLESKINTQSSVDRNQIGALEGNDSQGFNLENIQRRAEEEIFHLNEQYWASVENETSPQRIRDLFSRMESQKLAILNAVQDAKLQSAIASLHSKFIKPQFDEFGKVKQELEEKKAVAERSVKVGLWNSAEQQIAKEFSDWGKYKQKVKEMLKSRYKNLRDEVNVSGAGHIDVMKDLYFLASRKDHLEASKKPKRGLPGLQPTGKHIKTQKAGGSDWDDIRANHWSDIIAHND